MHSGTEVRDFCRGVMLTPGWDGDCCQFKYGRIQYAPTAKILTRNKYVFSIISTLFLCRNRRHKTPYFTKRTHFKNAIIICNTLTYTVFQMASSKKRTHLFRTKKIRIKNSPRDVLRGV